MNEEIHLTPTVSCGVAVGPEEVMPSISSSVLDWFEEVTAGDTRGDGYANEQLEISEEILEESLQSNWANEDAGIWSSEEPASLE